MTYGYFEEHDALLIWYLDEWAKGNRIKASKIKRVRERLAMRFEKYMMEG